jgi:hypothetical protein
LAKDITTTDFSRSIIITIAIATTITGRTTTTAITGMIGMIGSVKDIATNTSTTTAG